MTALAALFAGLATYQVLLFILTVLGVVFGAMAYTVSPTNRYMNSSSWGFTPTGGSNIPFTGITSAAYDEQISTKKEGADYDLFPTVSVCDYRDPTVTLETLDAGVGLVSTLIAGVKGTLIGTMRDAYNGVVTGGGAKLYTLSNAQLQGRNVSQPYREFGKQTLVFGAISSDGATHPMAVTAV